MVRLVHELLTSPTQVGFIILRTVCVYFFILAGFRISGKREVGQLAPFDFALILLIANAVQNAMVGPDTSLVGGLAAACVLLLINHALGHLAAKHRGLERLLRGHARVLVTKGQAHAASLELEGISHTELLQALRENGCATVEECRLAVLEVDGTISVVAKKDLPPKT
jgi:uncharacterized membrane protein YcaP (DUF421 family)